MLIIISPSKEMADDALTSQQEPIFSKFIDQKIGSRGVKDGSRTYQALSLYNGLQFRYLKNNLQESDLIFLENHLRILSARYGIVRPYDGILPYRLDFQEKGLYKLWGKQIYQTLAQEDRLILNLASEEYAKTIRPYRENNFTLIDVEFYEQTSEGDLKKHSTISKKGRGQLVNYLAREKNLDRATIESFSDMDYQLDTVNSSPQKLVFIRPKD